MNEEISEEIKTFCAQFTVAESPIIFYVGGKETIRLEPNGDIYIKGNLTTNDMELVNAMREQCGLDPIAERENEISR